LTDFERSTFQVFIGYPEFGTIVNAASLGIISIEGTVRQTASNGAMRQTVPSSNGTQTVPPTHHRQRQTVPPIVKRCHPLLNGATHC
jgi:hypothetical protein